MSFQAERRRKNESHQERVAITRGLCVSFQDWKKWGIGREGMSCCNHPRALRVISRDAKLVPTHGGWNRLQSPEGSACHFKFFIEVNLTPIGRKLQSPEGSACHF